MAYAAGVDVGSTQTKAVLIDEEKRIIGRALTDTGANVMRAAESAFQEARAEAGVREEPRVREAGIGMELTIGRYFAHSRAMRSRCRACMAGTPARLCTLVDSFASVRSTRSTTMTSTGSRARSGSS